MQGVTLWEIESLFEDHLRQLVGWAIYSFVAAVEVRALWVIWRWNGFDA
jgi:hypothetical protein